MTVVNGDEQDTSRMSVTIKTPGRDGAWYVFHGSPATIRDNIVATFAMEPTDAPLHQVVVNADALVAGVGAVAQAFPGSTMIGEGDAAKAYAPPAAPQREAKADPLDVLRARIESASTMAQIDSIWVDSQEALDANPAIMEAYMAKGRAVKASAA